MFRNNAKNKTEYKPSNGLITAFEWISASMSAVIIVSLLFAIAFRMVNVDGDSMLNTLHHGDRLLISNFAYTPDYGDIVVVRRKNDTPLIKRVIGLPGDVITIDDDIGVVYRNGEALDEPYTKDGFTPANGMPEQVIVQQGTVFVMGDNRGASLDSRMLGCQPIENVVGRVFYRIGPDPGIIKSGE